MADDSPARRTRSKRNILETLMLSEERPKKAARTIATTVAPTGETDNNDDETKATQQKKPPRQTCKATDDLICPITLELPYDPVTSEDGRVYERRAIETHIKTCRHNLKSPITNEPMGKKLLPAPQTKNLIQTLIDSGVITGPLVESWNKKLEEQGKMQQILREAESGDARALGRVGVSYHHGANGFKQDKKLGFHWSMRAHDAGDIKSTGRVGYCLLSGDGVGRDAIQGVMYLTMAAAKGSDFAAFRLGMALADGDHGLPVNPIEAAKWLRRSLSPLCFYRHLKESKRDDARAKLQILDRTIYLD